MIKRFFNISEIQATPMNLPATLASHWSVFAVSAILLALIQVANAEEPRELRIALMADPHCTLATEGRKATYARHFEAATRQINAAGVDLALVAGDLADSSKPEEWEAFLTQIKAIHTPVLYVAGNHDVGPKPNSGKDGVTNSQRYLNFVNAMGPGFWVKEFPGVRVIGITSSLLGTGLPEEVDQWNFLERTLAVPVDVPTVLLAHYPLFVETVDEPGGVYWNVEPEPRKRLLSLIKSGRVRAVLTGHLHRPLLHRQDGVLFAGAPPISFGLPIGEQPEGWMLITIPKQGEIQATIESLTFNN